MDTKDKAVQNAVMTTKVVDLINAANEAESTMSQTARDAAIAANETDFLDTPPAKRLEAILGLYMSILTHKAVKEVFSAALAVLVADKPVRIQSSGVTNKGDGTVSFQAAEAIAPVAEKGEKVPEGKIVTELTPQEAISKLTVGMLKQAATPARESLGAARAKGAGRKAAPAPDKRAPFFDELAAVLRDDALRLQCFRMIELAGYTITRTPTSNVSKKDKQAEKK